MDLTQSTDYLKFECNKLAQPFVNNDVVFFSGEIYKINRYWTPQKRILWITSKYILNLKRDRDRVDAKGNPDLTGLTMKRIISITNLRAVTKSVNDKSFEFVIHVPTEYDYRYAAKSDRNRDEIIQAIKLAFLSTCKSDLEIYGVSHRFLGRYTRTSKGTGRSTKIPDRKYLLLDEWINLNDYKKSVGVNSDPDKEIWWIDNEDFELIEDYADMNRKHVVNLKKSKSACLESFGDTDYINNLAKDAEVNDRINDPKYEEQKMCEEISDDELDINFDLNEEDFDFSFERSETIYSKHEEGTQQIKAKDFILKKLLRTTETGKVFLAQHNKTQKCYALKSIKKDQFLKSFKSFEIQKELVLQVHHPFISSFEYAFQNEYRIYIVSELLNGGELESLIKKKGILSEKQAKFYAIQLVLVLGYLHANDIVYRNLTASNILINKDGYIKLGDFDCCSRITKTDLSKSICRLREYQAPEVVSKEGHDQTIDWWALGVVLSQMLFKENVLNNNEVNIPENSIVSQEAKDLIIKLLERDRNNRLGSTTDYVEILEHNFFSDIDIKTLLGEYNNIIDSLTFKFLVNDP